MNTQNRSIAFQEEVAMKSLARMESSMQNNTRPHSAPVDYNSIGNEFFRNKLTHVDFDMQRRDPGPQLNSAGETPFEEFLTAVGQTAIVPLTYCWFRRLMTPISRYGMLVPWSLWAFCAVARNDGKIPYITH